MRELLMILESARQASGDLFLVCGLINVAFGLLNLLAAHRKKLRIQSRGSNSSLTIEDKRQYQNLLFVGAGVLILGVSLLLIAYSRYSR